MNIFLDESEKKNIVVGFSKKEISNHQGISGLKYYLVVMFFRKHLETFGEVSFTLNKLIDECGYSTKSHNDSIYSDFRKILKEEILDKGYASSEQDILKIRPTALFTLKLSNINNLFFTDDTFVQLSIYEYEKITKSNAGRINKSVIIGVYLYIKQYILADSNITGGFLKIAYPSKQQIQKGIGISSITTIENAITILANLKLIYVKSDMFVEDKYIEDRFIPARNVFALNKTELKYEDRILEELSRIYGKPVYTKQNVPGKLMFIKE